MFILNCNIKIISQKIDKSIVFDYVSSVTINTSVYSLTDTAVVMLPRKLSYQGIKLTDIIARNDEIKIQLGYGSELITVFTGYITNVSTGTPIELTCENKAWTLKQIIVGPKHYAKLNLKDFVTEMLPSEKTYVNDVDFGEVIINEETALAEVFDYFVKNYPVSFFYKADTLYGVLSGTMLMKADQQKTHKFKVGWNIIDDNMEYTLADDVKIQIVAKAILQDNTKLEWKEPANRDGDVRTFFVPGAKSLKDLELYAKEKLATFKQDKMDGSFTAFGEPHVTKGDIVHIFDQDFEERNDKQFFVESVNYSFDSRGYRQNISLGYEL